MSVKEFYVFVILPFPSPSVSFHFPFCSLAPSVTFPLTDSRPSPFFLPFKGSKKAEKKRYPNRNSISP